ncbi:MAG: MFS transporter [Ignavibacteriaceae bacterium]|nr:MFS transporter [Ignavibacteriaceae bacterium]
MKENTGKKSRGWSWIPTLYFAQGIPYVVVMSLSVIMYKRLGVSNTDIALYTSWLYLPWVIKPLWSPIVELLKTKRFWILSMQFLIGAALAGAGLTIPAPDFFKYSLILLWLLAFSSATHDIAADGFYMLGLSQKDQTFFVGIRSTFYRIAMITGQGLLIIFAGYLESSTGFNPVAVEVQSAKNIRQEYVLPDSLVRFESGDSDFYISSSVIRVSTSPVSPAFADSVIKHSKERNLGNGFYQTEEAKAQAPVVKVSPGWYDNYIKFPLEKFLKENFSPAKLAEIPELKSTGNIGVVYIKLKADPQGQKVVTVQKESGDASITLIEGQRLVFDSNNWNKPAILLFQLDPKLTYSTSTIFEARSGNIPLAWSLTFFFIAAMFIALAVYHKVVLPKPESDRPSLTAGYKNILIEFFRTFALFFRKERIGIILTFLLLYRFAEAQLVKLATPFLLDARDVGGLALTTGEIGIVYGTVGVLSLTLGGILGGMIASKYGLKKVIWFMVCAIHLPDLNYVYLSYFQPESFITINFMVAIEQFGYGFGFTAYMLYMIYASQGEYKTAHYAICTGFMALGMMLPGMFSGWLQEIIGYQHFFIWVMISTIPAFLIIPFLKLDPEFGKKAD